MSDSSLLNGDMVAYSWKAPPSEMRVMRVPKVGSSKVWPTDGGVNEVYRSGTAVLPSLMRPAWYASSAD